MMNVLADYKGSRDLYYSLHALFEKRLRWNLYRPIGKKWREKGFHRLNIPIGLNVPALHPSAGVFLINGVYHYIPLEMRYKQKAITFDKFLKMDIDVILTTAFTNEEAYYNLVKNYKPNSIFIRQIANIHEKPIVAKNVLLSTLEPMPQGINYIIYIPENPDEYHYTPPTNHKLIRSFSRNLPSYPQDLRTWNRYKSTLKDFTFRMHGTGGQNIYYEGYKDGFVPHILMSQAIKESAFVWHMKPGGGGWIPRQAMASGRPCIVRRCYCEQHNTLCKNLFHDSIKNGPINCIDLDLRKFKENIKLIKELSQPDRHIELCKSIEEQFKKDVNFAEQAGRIKEWILSMRRK